jgi:hypothetical protein
MFSFVMGCNVLFFLMVCLCQAALSESDRTLLGLKPRHTSLPLLIIRGVPSAGVQVLFGAQLVCIFSSPLLLSLFHACCWFLYALNRSSLILCLFFWSDV